MKHPTHHIEKFFYCLGAQIGRHPKTVINSILFLTFISTFGLLNFKEANNVRSEYSPLRAPSQIEYRVAKTFLKQNGTLDPCYIMTSARDGGSLLRDQYRWLIYNLTRALQTEVVVYKEIFVKTKITNVSDVDESNKKFAKSLIFDKTTKYLKKLKKYTFADLCEPYCELNTALLAFLKLYDPRNPSTFTYPSIDLFGTKVFIGNNVYGVKMKQKNNVKTNELESFTTAVMPFYIVANYEDIDVIIKWQHAAIQLFERPEYSTLLKTGMTGDNLVSYEVRRMGMETAPLIVGSVLAMIVFVVATSFRVNAIQSKPWETLLGCFIPLLAMLTAMGLMSGLGMRFQSIVVAAIFLVLSVGIDDIFILTRAWHRTLNTLSMSERMALTLEDAGPSITISALTNVMSFAIGAISDTPAVRTFCMFSAVAITICYIYQLILLSAVILLLSDLREKKGYRSFLCCYKANLQARHSFVAKGEQLHAQIVRWWATIVSKWSTRLILTLVMIVYFAVSYVGIRRLKSNISIDKMALPDSYLHDFQQQFETALRNMQPISVFVLQPGDLRIPDQLQRVKNLVYDFENSLNAYGYESTFFWLTQYEDFLRFYNINNEDSDEEFNNEKGANKISFSYTEIPAFFKSATYYYLNSFVHMNETACYLNNPSCISSFFFITNFHDVIKYHELVPTVNDWRRITNNYSDLQVYAYSDHTPFVDQTMSIDQTVFGSVAAALICTAVICLFFIPHFMSVVAAVFSVFSISWGIFGLLSLWNVDLDPLSMAALLMAIGFSVDFTAHISYHYYKAPHGSGRRRMQVALGVIGWPMVQVGLSTIVALMPLLFKQSYLAMVFLKTIVVVVLLGMFHGLVILPAVLTLFNKTKDEGKLAKKKHLKRIDLKKKLSNCGSYSMSGASSTLSTDTTSGNSITTDSGSERSFQQSKLEKKSSFYKTQHLFKPFCKNKEFGWLNRRQSFFDKSTLDHNFAKNHFANCEWNLRQNNKIVTLSVAELEKVSTKCNPIIAKTAFVHKIALGRSASNAL